MTGIVLVMHVVMGISLIVIGIARIMLVLIRRREK